MVTEELLRYVEYQSGRGVDRNAIKMTLLQNGWSGDDITEAFKIVDTVSGAEQTLQSSAVNQAQTANVGQGQTNQPVQPIQTQALGANSAQPIQGQVSNGVTQPASESNQSSQIQPGQSQTNQAPNDQSQLNQAQPAQQNLSNQSSQVNNLENNSGVQQSAATSNQASNPQSQNVNQSPANGQAETNPINSLKYRTAQDWQNNQVSGNQPLATVGNQVGQSNQAQPASTPQSNNQATAPDQANGVYLQSTTGSVVSANQSNLETQNNATQPQMNQSGQANATGTTNPVSAAPKTALQQNQQENSGKGKKITLIALIFIVLIALGVAGYYYYNVRESSPQYNLTDVVNSLNSQDYVVYAADGALPVAYESIDDSAPIAVSRLDQPQVSFSSNGIIAPMSNKGGFEIVVGESKFDYVYDGQDSFGRIRALPSDLKDSFDDSLNNWFKFSEPENTRMIQQFFTNNPHNSMPATGKAIVMALTDLHNEDLIEMSYISSYQDDGKKVDEFDFSMDARQFLSRLDTDASIISSILSYLDVSNISGQVTIDRESMLPMIVQLDLSDESTMVIEFSYEHLNQDIVAPAITSPVSEIILPLLSLTEVSMVNKIRTSLRTVGSNASVYFKEQQSYQGFCDSEVIKVTIDNIADFSGNQPVCNSVSAGFAFQVPLPNSSLFACIDNDLVDTATQTALGSATACGEAVAFPEPKVVAPETSAPVESEAQTTVDDSSASESFFE